MKTESKITGKCYCGNVTYHISGEILRSGVCYCRDCQRLSASIARPFMVVMGESLHIKGTLKALTRLGASGNQVTMECCTDCGTALFGRFGAWPAIRTVSATTLDEPSLFSPEVQVWTQDAPKWFNLIADIPSFTRNAD
jgi:hypothetical protein